MDDDLRDCVTRMLARLQFFRDSQGATSEHLTKACDSLTRALPGRFDGRQETFQAMQQLTLYVHDELLHQRGRFFRDLISWLAELTREVPVCRFLFGELLLQSPDHERQKDASQPDCILEIARRVCSLNYPASSDVIETCLKIIGNCAADNPRNRDLLIERDGIEILLRLGEHEGSLHLLVPALYNICVQQGDEEDDDNTHEQHQSLVVGRLAAAYRSHKEFTTFEFLLSFAPIIEVHLRPYLAELVWLAAMLVEKDLKHICLAEVSGRDTWTWTFSRDGKDYDTIALMCDMVSDSESRTSIYHTAIALLSQQQPIKALLEREDDSVWRLLTIACTDYWREIQLLYVDTESSEERRALLKILYAVTDGKVLGENEMRAQSLITRCVSCLETCMTQDKGGKRLVYEPSGQDSAPLTAYVPDSSYWTIMASACVILSQIAAAPQYRDELLDTKILMAAIKLVFECVPSPDVLYPAVTLITRLSLSPRSELSFVSLGTLQTMQGLLQQTGLGVIVPFETVTAFKTIIRGRPELISHFLGSAEFPTPILETALGLFDRSIEAGTKLEVGKLFIEILRTLLSVDRVDHGENALEGVREVGCSATCLERVQSSSLRAIVDTFVWVCNHAEPQSQRDHGWFGLAMLSTIRKGSLNIALQLAQNGELRDSMLEASKLQSGPVRGNVMLMLSELHKVWYNRSHECERGTRDELESYVLREGKQEEVFDLAYSIARRAAQNLGMASLFTEDSMPS